MKSRMESASSWPEGPVVRVGQSISIDITWRIGQDCEVEKGVRGLGISSDLVLEECYTRIVHTDIHFSTYRGIRAIRAVDPVV